MNNNINHNDEEDIQGLLDQIKQQGTPYSEEPDPLYWANFRVRVMDRVETPERISVFAKAKSWLWESGLRAGLVGGGLAVLLLGGVYFGTQNDGPMVAETTKIEQQKTTTVDSINGSSNSNEQTPIAPNVITPDAKQDVPELAQDNVVPDQPQVVAVPQTPEQIALVAEAEAVAPTLIASNDGPATSLDDMNEAELTALLASVEAMN